MAFEQEFKEYVHNIFYLTNDKEDFNTFILDVSEPETSYYFLNGFIQWIKEVYNINVSKIKVLELYTKLSKYNIFMDSSDEDNIVDKFVITKKIMEEAFNNGIINELKYQKNNNTVRKIELE